LCSINLYFHVTGTLHLDLQSKQASSHTTPTLAVKPEKSSQKTAEEKEQSAASTSKVTSFGVTPETGEAQKAPTSENISSLQTATSDNSEKIESQSSTPVSDGSMQGTLSSKCHQSLGSNGFSSDPSPLISPRRADGDPAPRVVKRKALTPIGGQTVDAEKPPVDQHQGKDSSTACPIILPPQQLKAGASEVKSKSSAPDIVITMLVPNAEDDTRPETATPDATHSQHQESTALPHFEVMLSKSKNSTNANVSMDHEIVASSSTEQLIATASPEPLRPVRRIEDVKTIKRQPKGGWL
jgi:hypothetical protein